MWRRWNAPGALLTEQRNLSVGDRERLFGYLEGGGRIVLPEPQALLTEHPKLPGLDGQKMSKSYNNTIELREPARGCGPQGADHEDRPGAGAAAGPGRSGQLSCFSTCTKYTPTPRPRTGPPGDAGARASAAWIASGR